MKDRLSEIYGFDRDQQKREHAEYMKEWRRKKALREKEELEQALGIKEYPISTTRAQQCILFRRLCLGLESQDEYPFLKHNHLNFSLRGLKCRTCPRNCYCGEWFQSQKGTFQGAKIW